MSPKPPDSTAFAERPAPAAPQTTAGVAQLLHFTLNGEAIETLARPEETLLELLRYRLGFTGSKQGCDKGDCGACTVLIEDQPELACLTLALRCEGLRIRSVEGLANARGLHPMQRAFSEKGAAQCGFCTPGMLLSAVAFAEAYAKQAPASGELTPPSRESIQLALSGNLCRCTGYTKILEAVEQGCVDLAREGGS